MLGVSRDFVTPVFVDSFKVGVTNILAARDTEGTCYPCLCIHENSNDLFGAQGTEGVPYSCVCVDSLKMGVTNSLGTRGAKNLSHSCSCGFAKNGIQSTIGVPKGNSSLAFLDERTQAKDPKQTFPSKRSQAEDSNREIPSQRYQAEHSKRSCWTNPG